MRTLLTTLALGALASQALAQTPDWTEDFPTVDPTPRAGLQGASDGSKLYFFGGNLKGASSFYSDLWSYDGTTWAREAAPLAGPTGRVNYGLTWDAARNVLVFFGGKNFAGTDLGDTWEWTPLGGWTQVALTGTTPGPRRWHQLDYFPGLGCVLHAGKDVATGTVYDDTWAWDGTTWTQLANGPYQRQRGRMVYRTAHNDLIWYGGRDAANVKLNETWKFDGAAWTQIVTATNPGSTDGMFAHGQYYDTVRDLVVIFGGTQGGIEKNWNWEFDGTDWTEVFPATNPGIRTGHAIAWVESAKEAYMYGGFSGSQKDDTWRRAAFSGTGSFTVTGTGCATSVGLTAGLSATGLPTIGQNLFVDMTNATPGTIPVAVMGVSDTIWSGLPLPLDFSLVFPATPNGCNLYVSIDMTQSMAVVLGGATLSLPIPNKSKLIGVTFYVQGLQLELAPGGLWTSTSPYGTAVIGI